MKLKIAIIFLIIFFGVFLRFYKLGQIPVGLNIDEASIGYNAYSLLLTGRDEYGRFLPVSLESFGDWKLPVYPYLTILPVAILSLNEISVRLVSALAGCLSIGAIYLLTRELFRQEKRAEILSVLATLFFSFLPWNIYFSRIAYEANVALFFFIIGIWLFIRRRLLGAAIFWGLTFFTYHAALIFVPLIVLITRWRLKYVAILGVFLGFSAFFTLFGSITKISGTGLFSDPVAIYAAVDVFRADHKNSLISEINHNKLIFAVQKLVYSYVNFFSPQNLVENSSHPHSLPIHGNLTIMDYFFLVIGIFALLVRKPKYALFLLGWLLISPLPSVITRGNINYARAIFAAGVIPIISAYGLVYLFDRFHLKVLVPAIAIYFLVFANYLDLYFVHFPQINPQEWNGGFSRMVAEVTAQEGNYDKIILPRASHSPYILFLFYKKYPPQKYQAEAVRYPKTDEGFEYVKSFGKYYFLDDNSSLPSDKRVLMVDWEGIFPKQATASGQFIYYRDKPMYRLTELIL